MSLDSKFRTLGLRPGASWDEVKAAFRRLARVHHPDVAGPSGARRFSEITQAYMALKESISPGVMGGRSDSVSCPESEIVSPKKESIWYRFIKKIFFRNDANEEQNVRENEVPRTANPGRDRFAESAIHLAESQLDQLFIKAEELKQRNKMDAFVRRLRSKHPAVVLLALQQLSLREMTDEIFRILTDHFKKVIPPTEVLGSLLNLFTHSDQAAELGRNLCLHTAHYSASDALHLLRWLRRQKIRADCLPAFLSHSSELVVGGALAMWQQGEGLPDKATLGVLLQRKEYAILLPLLRILKREKISPWMLPAIDKISKGHSSPAVRVWAASIVREQELS